MGVNRLPPLACALGIAILAAMLWWAVVFLGVFLIGLTKSGFGSGVGLMIVPMTAIALGHIPGRGAEAALGLLLPLLITGDLVAVWQYRHRLLARPPLDGDAGPVPNGGDEPAAPVFSAAQILRRLGPGTVVGVVLGGLLLYWFHTQKQLVGALMRIEIGIESILLVGLHWWRQYQGMQQHLVREPMRSHLSGAFAGVSSTLAHAAGPIIAMYLLPLKLNRSLYVGVCALYFFLLNTAKLPAYWAAAQFERAEASFTLRFLPLVLAGAWFGYWVNRRLSDKLFTRIVYLLTFLLGWYILADGLVGLIKLSSWR